MQGRGGAQPHAAAVAPRQAPPASIPRASGPQASVPAQTLANPAETRANIARLFAELRAAMRLAPEAVAYRIQTHPQVIVALETAEFELLPPPPETARIVMAYTALAGIDGRHVLAAIAACLQAGTQVQHHQQPPHRTSPVALPVQRLRQAGSAFAHGAKRLPAGAMKQVRERPERAFYAVSLPLAILLLVLNPGSLQAAMQHMPRPVVRMVSDVRHFFMEQFAPVHDGLRWIEVDNPRRRRADKLPHKSQSD